MPLLGRVFVSLLGATLFVVLLGTRLPYVDQLIENAGDNGSLTVGGLGMAPISTAFILVELIALLVPRMRRVRETELGRAKLTLIAEVTSVLVAFPSAYAIATYLEAFGATGTQQLVIAGLLIAGVVLTVGTARCLTFFGVGNGYSVLFASSLALPIVDGLVSTFNVGITPMTVLSAALLVAPLLVVAVTASGTRHFAEPAPASGIIPLYSASAIVMLPVTIGAFAAIDTSGYSAALSSTSGGLVFVALIAVVCVLFAYLFHPRGRVPRVRDGLGLPSRPNSLAVALPTTVLCVCAIALLTEALARTRGTATITSGAYLALFAAVLVDLGRELRGRMQGFERVAAVLLRPSDARAALEALGRAGIPGEAQGLVHRTMLQFFGPHIAIRILVRAADEERARELVSPLRDGSL